MRLEVHRLQVVLLLCILKTNCMCHSIFCLLVDTFAYFMYMLESFIIKLHRIVYNYVCVAGILHLLSFKVCFEGEISKASVMQSLSRGKRASGDLIPWTVSQQVTSVGEVVVLMMMD